MANESIDDLYIHARMLAKECESLIREKSDTKVSTYGGSTDFMRQLDDINALSEAMIRQLRSLAWNLKFRVSAHIQERSAMVAPKLNATEGAQT